MVWGRMFFLLIAAFLSGGVALAGTIPAESMEKAQTQRIVHLLNRISYGPRPGDIDAVRRMGIDRYIQTQLNPNSIPDDQNLVKFLNQRKTLGMSPIDLYLTYGPVRDQQKATQAERQKLNSQRRRTARVIAQEAMENRMLRALYSERQLQEVMTEFWFNHFNITTKKNLCYLWVGAYERDVIRANALGKFRTILGATAHHPAMLVYLDNWQNTAPGSKGARGQFKGLNENYARELMELHTLGVDGGYTQADVVTLAKILTGWSIPIQRKQVINGGRSAFYFDAARHDNTPNKTLLGKKITAQGVAEGEAALDMLARHPSTARYISTKLAQYFVSDNPPKALIDKLAMRFTETDGDIKAVMDTLLHSPEFWDAQSMNAKYKPPYRYLMSSLRATAQPVDNAVPIQYTLNQLGMPLYGHETPDGYEYTQAPWLNPDGMIRRISFATALGSGALPLAKHSEGFSPPTAQTLSVTLGGGLSANTLKALQQAPDKLQAAIVLGSPEFMKY